MDYRDIYKNWLASGALTADEKAELSAISDDLNAQKTVSGRNSNSERRVCAAFLAQALTE